MLKKYLSTIAILLGLASMGPMRSQSAPVPVREYEADDDDDLKREERDARYMQQLQIKTAEDMAKGQNKLREEQERAAVAMRKLYEGLVEQKYKESKGFQNPDGAVEPGASLASQGQMLMGGGHAAAGSMGQYQGEGQGASMAPQTQKPGQGMGTEMAKALDALALEDGPEVARKNNLGFVPMGTIADVRLLTGVNTAIPGVVIGQLVFDLYDVDTRCIVVPRGSKLIGQASSMSGDTEGRGKVVFHTFVDPGGRVIPIATPVLAGNRIGVTGVDGSVDYHWGRMLGGSVALAALSAFSGGNSATYGNSNMNFQDTMRQQMSQSIGNAGQQFLNRFTRIQPDITLEEGSITKVIFVTSLMAKPYRMLAAIPQPVRLK